MRRDRIWSLGKLRANRRNLSLIAITKGFRYSTSKPRDPVKWRHLKTFLLRRMPPPKEILSGDYYRRRLSYLVSKLTSGQTTKGKDENVPADNLRF